MAESSLETVRAFFVQKEGSVLLTWRRWFGPSEEANHGKIDREDFAKTLKDMGYDGDIETALAALDEDNSGCITLDKIDQMSDDLWISFTRWCAHTFTTAEELVSRFSCNQFHARSDHIAIQTQRNAAGSQKANSGDGKQGFTKMQFINNAARLGWFGAHEAMLFAALDEESKGRVYGDKISWFERERQKELKRNATKKRGRRGSLMGMRTKVHAQQSLQAFIAFLKIKYGCLFRAWRKCIDRDGDMAVDRSELFQACKVLQWNGDATSLWKALDADDSGTTTLEELAMSVARPLALFKRWADKSFGNARSMFKALDALDPAKWKSGHFECDDWIEACEQLQCPVNAEEIFNLLDWERDNELTLQKVRCLDRWTPEEFLMCDPSQTAAEELKHLFIKKYKHWLAAWRFAIDRDACGRVNWTEFKQAAASVMFTGDVAGAWLHVDANCSGFITLAELDETVANSLSEYRRWAQHEYGSVLLGFDALLGNGAESVTRKEFRKKMKAQGFKGDADALFRSLDTDGSAALTRSEVAFLDEWELAEMEEYADEPQQIQKPDRHRRSSFRSVSSSSHKPQHSRKHRESFHPLVGHNLLEYLGMQASFPAEGAQRLASVPWKDAVDCTGRHGGRGLEAISKLQTRRDFWRRPHKLPPKGAYTGGLPYARKQTWREANPESERGTRESDSRPVFGTRRESMPCHDRSAFTQSTY